MWNVQAMTDGKNDNRAQPADKQDSEASSPTTLLPMLIGGLVLITIGMIVVMTFA